MKASSRALLLLALIPVLLISGCNLTTTAPAEPTLDVEALREEILGTVVAQITADAPKASPTAAPTITEIVKPTTGKPTSTQSAISTLAPLATFTASPLTTRYPTWTSTPYTDRATLSYQSLADGYRLARGQDFDVKWVIKNQGVRDWNNQFYARYISGIKADNFDHIMLPPVNKGGEVTVVGDFVAPSNPGFYVTQWGLVNDDGVTFFRFNFTFYVD